ncbi:MAG: cbb3-type cytochrome c oxidase subunit I [Thermanaeromonas sp.]|uniref:cbb3-type cytochrome c oxidase subunit I n=1 Tax=Thermanaeromonas sp. TaxID=2003697 RepID=UPI0024387BC6|nr:cbb3-type cytochrome c oxidase subunit I [Thermanaeromonas sp.]MCG0277139.1 cbb3-type cytochrome c oxidase subunit I [Thermanaeromonas sp.]
MLEFFLKLFFKKGNKKDKDHDSPSQKASYPYALSVFTFLALQSFLATGGSLHLVFPDLPTPIAFTSGRAMHLNLSLLWPLLGIMGSACYFIVEFTGNELYTPKLIKWNFWYLLITILLLLASLALGHTEGREYLEAPFPFKVALLVGFLFFILNLLISIFKNRLLYHPETIIMFSGFLLASLLYLPNLFPVLHPTVDDTFRFLVVHLWEEGSLELVATTVASLWLATLKVVPLNRAKRLILWEAILVLFSGALASAHHLYWIGLPRFWQLIGAAASAIQVIPIVLLGITAFRSLYSSNLNHISLYFFYSSVFWNIVGVGLLGFLLALPPLNFYVHGTYLTSAHSHMALFGFFGFLVLGTSYFILTRRYSLSAAHKKRVKLSVILLNSGLAIMSGSLILTGLLQSYLCYVAGLNFTRTHLLLHPYLLLRAAGGAVFGAGAFLLALEMWLHFFRLVIFQTLQHR